jgi:putative flavoprotein involved in K+ transport
MTTPPGGRTVAAMLTNEPRTSAPDAAAGAAQRIDTIVMGAGQAGLSVGYLLARRGVPFLILEADDRVGVVWRRRFDSLRHYTPKRYDGLPCKRWPGDRWTFPTKDEMADYLEDYAREFELPVRTGVAVDGLVRDGGRLVVSAGAERFVADHVIIASGTWQSPVTPAFASELDPRIVQLHSDDYRNPSQLTEGPVLAVGASHSGADIAYEVARHGHPTTLAGPTRGEVPFDIEGRPARAIMRVLWFMANHVLTLSTPLGRKMSRHVRGEGGPLLRIRNADLQAAGVERSECKVAGVRDGLPVLEDGRVVEAANVIWCTGFRKDLSWLGIDVTGDDGWPVQERGAVPSVPGLYFVGLPFLQAFGSMLVGGVGRDAARIARQVAARPRAAVA